MKFTANIRSTDLLFNFIIYLNSKYNMRKEILLKNSFESLTYKSKVKFTKFKNNKPRDFG